MKELMEIKNFLKEKSNDKTKESWRKFIPTSEKVYGVHLTEINKIVLRYKSGGFALVKELWKSGYFEERILASKILGKICKKNPDLTLRLIKEFVNDITDWAICDTLATQGVRPISKIKQKEILELSKHLIRSSNLWKRRFAIVLLINFKKEKSLRNEILNIIKEVENDKEYYVKKAVEWIKRSLK